MNNFNNKIVVIDLMDSCEEEDTISLYLNSIRDCKSVDAEETKNLLDEVRRGNEEAGQRLVDGYLLRVAEAAIQYAKADGHERYFPEALDLVSVGNTTLEGCVEEYDRSSKKKFDEFLNEKLIKAFDRELRVSEMTIRIPGTIPDNIREVCDKWLDMEEKNGHEPSVEELFESFNGKYSMDFLKIVKEICRAPLKIGISSI